VTPETALPGTTSGERRRAATGSAPVRVWDPDGPTDGSIAPPLWDALRDAVLWAQSEWERAIEHAAGMDEVTTHLAQVCAAIRQQASGQNPDLTALPRNALSRRLVGLVRAAFLERAQALTAVDPSQLLRMLAALEQVSQRLEADWSQHFADRLSGPDGLELVVEVAHDLRSPLTSILFLAETLQRARSGPVNPAPLRSTARVRMPPAPGETTASCPRVAGRSVAGVSAIGPGRGICKARYPVARANDAAAAQGSMTDGRHRGLAMNGDGSFGGAAAVATLSMRPRRAPSTMIAPARRSSAHSLQEKKCPSNSSRSASVISSSR